MESRTSTKEKVEKGGKDAEQLQLELNVGGLRAAVIVSTSLSHHQWERSCQRANPENTLRSVSSSAIRCRRRSASCCVLPLGPIL